MADDYLTIEQADQRLGHVVPLLETARKMKREIEMIAAGCDYDTILLEEQRPRIVALVRQLTEKVEQLEDLGCYVKDLDVGIVNFLSRFEGRDVFLSWKLGEQRVMHWHEIDEGFSCRQQIVDMTDLEVCYEFETPYVENEN